MTDEYEFICDHFGVLPPLQWKEITPAELMDSKLRCVFEMSVDQVKASPSNKAPGTRRTPEPSRSFHTFD